VDKQEELFVSRIARSEGDGLDDDAAVASAATVVAVPGASEHHTGLALDIVSNGYQLLDEGQEGTPENQWLREHCADYGFILRYPVGSTDETGIIYEPWHFRYVGKKAAKEIMEHGITFEAYSGAV
ncbi:MAG: M15 family metallopeptidase, partial [Eubacteriales bacterium]|nr:M15 family metallopeptidase [Eubacteriales bacterium]